MEDTIKLKVAASAFQFINRTSTTQFNSLITFTPTPLHSVHNYNTRAQANKNLYPSFARTRLGQSSLEYQLPIIWNEIPTSIKNSSNLNMFKIKYKEHLINNYIE